jgi:hypothetical protein
LQRNEDAEFAIDRLLGVDRVLTALREAGSAPEKLSRNTLLRVLQAGLEALPTIASSDGTMWQYYLERIFARVRNGEIDEMVVGKLEWGFLPLFRFLPFPVALYRLLQKDAQFFAEIVSLACPLEGDEGEAVMEEPVRRRTELGLQLLSEWHTPPGLGMDGTLDPIHLREWLAKARAACAAAKRSAVCDYWIGQILSSVPVVEDGVWPHPCVRDVIEDAASVDLEEGLRRARVNSRGVTVRSPFEGGLQERKLAKQYREWARGMGAQWRTARLLNSLADIYEAIGKSGDVRAELREAME